MQPACILVDPYISVETLCDAMYARGISPIVVLTSLNISENEKKSRFQNEARFPVVYQLINDDYAHIQHKLKEQPIVGVIPGHENSLLIADKISELLSPSFSNNSESTSLRNNKFNMLTAIKNEQLSVPDFSLLSAETMKKDWMKQMAKWKFPVFVKPVNSSCGFGGKRCNNLKEISLVANELFQTLPVLGNKIDEVIVQEFISGDEYFVDTVSLNGNHFVTSVFKYHKLLYKGSSICRYSELIDIHDKNAATCIDYTKEALSAIDFRFGMAHTELFITDKGPSLVEVNPRISGAYGYPNKLALLAYNYNQATILLEMMLNPHHFFKHFKYPSLNRLHGLVVSLYKWESGKLDFFNMDKIKSLSSHLSTLQIKSLGTYVQEPKSLFDMVGIVLLVNQDRDKLFADYQKLALLEESGEIYNK